MYLSATAQELIDGARELADAETTTPSTDHVKDTELLRRLSLAYQELVDFIAGNSDAGIELLAVSAAVTGPAFTLPADFYRLVAVDLPDPSNSTRWIDALSFNFRDRNAIAPSSVSRYRLVGSALTFQRNADGKLPDSARIWYVPTFDYVTDLGAALNTFGGWDDYLIGSLAMYIADKEERDAGRYLAYKEAAEKRIELVCANLVLAGTQTIATVELQPEAILDVEGWTRG